jgi:hypothetical protein
MMHALGPHMFLQTGGSVMRAVMAAWALLCLVLCATASSSQAAVIGG